MAYIYQIVNDINGKVYVGKTEFSIEKRFQEHCRDYKKERNEKRPLYAAMRKYGVEHFHISLLEETNNPEERECYWIEQLRSFKNGYNATMGGDGKKYVDYDLVINLYAQYRNQVKVAEILHICEDTVHKILIANKIAVDGRGSYAIKNISKSVVQLDNNQKIIMIYSNSIEAGKAIKSQQKLSSEVSTIAGHIRAVCQGKRKTAYKFFWKFI